MGWDWGGFGGIFGDLFNWSGGGSGTGYQGENPNAINIDGRDYSSANLNSNIIGSLFGYLSPIISSFGVSGLQSLINGGFGLGSGGSDEERAILSGASNTAAGSWQQAQNAVRGWERTYSHNMAVARQRMGMQDWNGYYQAYNAAQQALNQMNAAQSQVNSFREQQRKFEEAQRIYNSPEALAERMRQEEIRRGGDIEKAFGAKQGSIIQGFDPNNVEQNGLAKAFGMDESGKMFGFKDAFGAQDLNNLGGNLLPWLLNPLSKLFQPEKNKLYTGANPWAQQTVGAPQGPAGSTGLGQYGQGQSTGFGQGQHGGSELGGEDWKLPEFEQQENLPDMTFTAPGFADWMYGTGESKAGAPGEGSIGGYAGMTKPPMQIGLGQGGINYTDNKMAQGVGAMDQMFNNPSDPWGQMGGF